MCAVDLHVHSTKSDGTLTPNELVDYAIQKGLTAFALTDHDTTDGLDEILDYAKGKAIEVIPGIEFSTDYNGKDVHIVGLYIDYHNEEFQRELNEFRDSRLNRNIKMCNKLREEGGIDISYDKLVDEYGKDVVLTRAHYATYLLNHGYVNSRDEAFDKYIGDRCKYYVSREKVTPLQAVKLILKAGGIPILAHPILYHLSDKSLRELVSLLKDNGLIGIEAIYSTYKPHEERLIRSIAKEFNLTISGGSDFHGEAKPGLDLGTGYGKLCIPDEVLINIKKQLN